MSNSDLSTDLSTWDVLVGRVRGHWNKADLKIQPFSTAPGRFDAGQQLCVVVENRRQLLTIKSSRFSGNHWICDVGFMQTVQAEALKGAELFIHPEMRVPLPEGEFYPDEMLGWRVVTETGEELGELEEVIETPAHDVLATAEALIPDVPDFIVKKDAEAKLITVRDMPGLKFEE